MHLKVDIQTSKAFYISIDVDIVAKDVCIMMIEFFTNDGYCKNQKTISPHSQLDKVPHVEINSSY